MKKQLSCLLSTILALTLIAVSGATPAVAASQTLKRTAAEKASLLLKSHETNSVQYALIDNGKITLSGQIVKDGTEGKRPLTKDTLYGIGSVSKVVAASAVMKLVDQGKIDLDTPVVQYIPDFNMKDERYKLITPRLLLNHASGLRGTGSTNSSLFEDNDTFYHDTFLQTLSE